MKLSNFAPDFDKDGKRIYVIVGLFQCCCKHKYIFRLQLLKLNSLLQENDFIVDGGNANSTFTKGIDFGNSNTIDFVSKNFNLFFTNIFIEQLEFDDNWSKEFLTKFFINNKIKLDKVIGYIYPLEKTLELKNKNYIFIEY